MRRIKLSILGIAIYGRTFVHRACRRLVDEDVDETDTAFGGLSCWAFLTHRQSIEHGEMLQKSGKISPQLFNMIFSYIFEYSLYISINCFFVSWILKQPIGVFKNQLPRS